MVNPVPQDPATEGQSPAKCDTMEHNGTLQGMSPAKMKAIQGLAAGQTVVDAAIAAGVGRTTLHRWLRENAVFQEEVNRRRRELRLRTLATLERRGDKAEACVEKAIENGDVKAAQEVLRRRDRFAAGPIGSGGSAELASGSGERSRPAASVARHAGCGGESHGSWPRTVSEAFLKHYFLRSIQADWRTGALRRFPRFLNRAKRNIQRKAEHEPCIATLSRARCREPYRRATAGSASDKLDWQRHIRSKKRREELAKALGNRKRRSRLSLCAICG